MPGFSALSVCGRLDAWAAACAAAFSASCTRLSSSSTRCCSFLNSSRVPASWACAGSITAASAAAHHMLRYMNRSLESSQCAPPWRALETFQRSVGGPRESGASRGLSGSGVVLATSPVSACSRYGRTATTAWTAPSTVPSAAWKSHRRFFLTSFASPAMETSACEAALAECQMSWVRAPCCARSSRKAQTIRNTAYRRRLMTASFCQTFLEAGEEQVLRQLLADEHQQRFLPVGLGPGLAEVAAHHHVHALEHDAARIALHPQHALVAQEIRAVHLDHAREELLELRAVERLLRAEHERLDLVVVLVLHVGEELGVELEDRVQVEAADVEHLVDRRVAEVHLLDRRARIHALQPFREILNISFRNQIGLRHQDAVRESHLLLRLVELVELLRRVLGVHVGDDRVEQVVVADLLVGEEGLRQRAGVGHAGGRDHHAVELERALVALLLEAAEDADQVAAHRAADAAVVHLDDLLVALLDQRAVDPDLADLVLDHRDAPAVVLPEDAVEQRGLAAAEEAGEDRHRHHVRFFHERSWRRARFYPSRPKSGTDHVFPGVQLQLELIGALFHAGRRPSSLAGLNAPPQRCGHVPLERRATEREVAIRRLSDFVDSHGIEVQFEQILIRAQPLAL